ncbi:hypothetical protein ACFWPA_19425 [Rhodococcus sp. NPDC058505]|uniref:LppU family putative lipoprotein n=1 Tax=unclassified Rhodococcus (in: high G+C Gram-positive bacteria) TaxID=192944 RepID=UPI003668FAE2
MTRWTTPMRVAGILAGVVFAVGACSAPTVEGTASAQVTAITGQDVGDGGGSTDFRAEVGDCVNLGGSVDAAEIEHATCGSMDSNYKVIGKASENAQCPSDADQVYYETYDSVEQGALCLDIDWVVGGCMSVPDSSDEPFRVECTDPTATWVERVTAIVEDVTDVERCEEGGFTHPDRRFTVCTESVNSY